jgi:hypothetical protein
VYIVSKPIELNTYFETNAKENFVSNASSWQIVIRIRVWHSPLQQICTSIIYLPKGFGEYGVCLLYSPFGPVSGLYLSAVTVCGVGFGFVFWFGGGCACCWAIGC